MNDLQVFEQSVLLLEEMKTTMEEDLGEATEMLNS